MQFASTSKSIHDTDRLRSQIDQALGDRVALPRGCPPQLRDAMQYSLLGPGKRLRPMLVLMACEACGGTIEDALPAACAVEMVHAYSLVHDDLPAMDDDDLRRGRPTCHKKFGEAVAILTGDALLSLAFETLAEGIEPPQAAARCCAMLARAAGASALVGGQVDDLAAAAGDLAAAASSSVSGAEPGNSGVDAALERLESIHHRKTGAMILVSLRLGATIAGADARQAAALLTYGEHLGLAFQVTDDLLDARGQEAAVGKRVGKDADLGKLTFPGLLGIDRSIRRAERLVSEACAVLGPLGPRAEKLEALARYVLERNR